MCKVRSILRFLEKNPSIIFIAVHPKATSDVFIPVIAVDVPVTVRNGFSGGTVPLAVAEGADPGAAAEVDRGRCICRRSDIINQFILDF